MVKFFYRDFILQTQKIRQITDIKPPSPPDDEDVFSQLDEHNIKTREAGSQRTSRGDILNLLHKLYINQTILTRRFNQQENEIIKLRVSLRDEKIERREENVNIGRFSRKARTFWKTVGFYTLQIVFALNLSSQAKPNRSTPIYDPNTSRPLRTTKRHPKNYRSKTISQPNI